MTGDGDGGLLPPAGEAGIYLLPEADVAPLSAAAAACGVRCVRLDLRDCATREGFLDRISSALSFPAHVGRNWDALADALGDLGRPGDPGMVLVLLNSGRLRSESGAAFQTAMDVLQAGSTEWAGRRCPLWVFVALEEGECRTGG